MYYYIFLTVLTLLYSSLLRIRLALRLQWDVCRYSIYIDRILAADRQHFIE